MSHLTTQLVVNKINPEDNNKTTFSTDKWFKSFMPIFHCDIESLVKSTPSKSCELDPIPTKHLKTNISILAYPVMCITNKSLQDGIVCDEMKEVLLRPFLKANLDFEKFPSFRLVSNLLYLSKLVEQIVCNQLMGYTESTGNLKQYQSAYHENHSMETALLKVKCDILDAIDKKEVLCLVLLDLSTAFDTISHAKLLNCLKYRFGITDTVLNWIESYLTNHTQCVVITDENGSLIRSKKKPLLQGVPQGSCLGSILFILFISPLGEIIRSHRLSFKVYADDSQNYLTFRPIKNNPQPQQECVS